MEDLKEKFKHIKGWGIDADPENEPTYPMKKWTGDDHKRLDWERPPQQPVNIEVLHSNERPNIPAAFGTSVPPSGLSGAIRRFAFRYSESSYGHWLPLLLADRVNMVEGLVDDLKQGIFPNIFAEKGWKGELKHNKAGLAQKVLVGTAFTAAFVAFLYTKNKKGVSKG